MQCQRNQEKNKNNTFFFISKKSSSLFLFFYFFVFRGASFYFIFLNKEFLWEKWRCPDLQHGMPKLHLKNA